MKDKITIGEDGLPQQIYNGKVYKLYNGDKYFQRAGKRMHRVVWETENKKNVPKGYDIHHINGNTWDNNINNLECIERSIHCREHGKKRFINNPEWAKKFNEAGREKAKEWHKSEEGREWHKEQGSQTWVGREYKIKNCIVCGKEYKTRYSGESKYCHQNCKATELRRRRKNMS